MLIASTDNHYVINVLFIDPRDYDLLYSMINDLLYQSIISQLHAYTRNVFIFQILIFF